MRYSSRRTEARSYPSGTCWNRRFPWGGDESALRDPKREEWLLRQFELAKTDVFSSIHTCLPVRRPLPCAGGDFFVINNGAAGMPNFRNRLHGIILGSATFNRPFNPCTAKNDMRSISMPWPCLMIKNVGRPYSLPTGGEARQRMSHTSTVFAGGLLTR